MLVKSLHVVAKTAEGAAGCGQEARELWVHSVAVAVLFLRGFFLVFVISQAKDGTLTLPLRSFVTLSKGYDSSDLQLPHL